MRSLRVLIVEDSVDDALLLTDHLRRADFDTQSRVVDDISDLESALSEEWDIIISDYVLPDFSAMDALNLAREKAPATPFLVVSGKMGEDVAVETMKAGASDYILKGNLSRLAPAVERELREAEVRRERRAARKALAESEERYRTLFERSEELRKGIENALERERHFSLLLQRALLPATPMMVEGYSIGVGYVPVFVNREIGGDFYDVYNVSNCRAGILIGDVSGKGLEAAAMAATARSTLHAFIHETASPGEALTRTDAVLGSSQIVFESFVTVCLVVLDIRSGDFSYSSAGHLPAMISRSSGEVDMLEFGGMPLGLGIGRQFGENYGHLGGGDKLVLYTDGISEARHGSELLELEGVRRILRENLELPATDLARALIEGATQWAGGKLSDDAAVVVLERQSVPHQ